MSFFSRKTDLSTVTTLQTVPGADGTDNVNARDVTGNKTDAAVSVVAATKSLLGYMKGLINRLDKHTTPHMVYSGSSGTTYTNIMNVTDKGILKSVTIMPVTPNTTVWAAYLKVVIDAVIVYDGKVMDIDYTTDVGLNGLSISLPLDFQFETSCQVQVKADTAARYVYGMAVYTTD